VSGADRILRPGANGLDEYDARTFTQPIPVNGITVRCRNESNVLAFALVGQARGG
jgi:hypothetical protein